MDAIKFGVHRLIDSEDEEHGNAILRAIRINSDAKQQLQLSSQVDMRPINHHNNIHRAGAPYLCPPSPVLRISRSRSRSPQEDLHSRSRSSSSELEVDSPPHSPHRIAHPPSAISPVLEHLPRLQNNTTTHLELGQMGKRSELFSVTNLLREDLPKVQKSPFAVNMFRPHMDVLR